MTKPVAEQAPPKKPSPTNPFVFTRLAETHVEVGVIVPMELAKSLSEDNIITLTESFAEELVEIIQACQLDKDTETLN